MTRLQLRVRAHGRAGPGCTCPVSALPSRALGSAIFVMPEKGPAATISSRPPRCPGRRATDRGPGPTSIGSRSRYRRVGSAPSARRSAAARPPRDTSPAQRFIGDLTVESLPSGAAVFIDQRDAGRTPVKCGDCAPALTSSGSSTRATSAGRPPRSSPPTSRRACGPRFSPAAVRPYGQPIEMVRGRRFRAPSDDPRGVWRIRPCHQPAAPAVNALKWAAVTRRNVAGIDVASLAWLRVLPLEEGLELLLRSAALPCCSAAANAFIVGP